MKGLHVQHVHVCATLVNKHWQTHIVVYLGNTFSPRTKLPMALIFGAPGNKYTRWTQNHILRQTFLVTGQPATSAPGAQITGQPVIFRPRSENNWPAGYLRTQEAQITGQPVICAPQDFGPQDPRQAGVAQDTIKRLEISSFCVQVRIIFCSFQLKMRRPRPWLARFCTNMVA